MTLEDKKNALINEENGELDDSVLDDVSGGMVVEASGFNGASGVNKIKGAAGAAALAGAAGKKGAAALRGAAGGVKKRGALGAGGKDEKDEKRRLR